jgi:hypothetical protein
MRHVAHELQDLSALVSRYAEKVSVSRDAKNARAIQRINNVPGGAVDPADDGSGVARATLAGSKSCIDFHDRFAVLR